MALAAIGTGVSQAGAGDLHVHPGEDDGSFDHLLEDLLEGGQAGGPDGGPGGEGHGHDHDCPPVRERLGMCKPDDGGDPQDDFQAFEGTPKRGERRGGGTRRSAGDGGRAERRRGGAASSGEVEGFTTIDRTIVGGDPAEGFQFLEVGPGEPRIVREDLAEAQSGRAGRRVSLFYGVQTTDWQVPDEESPLRVEFLEPLASPPFPPLVSGAWRPQEAFVVHAVDQVIRQINLFVDASPVAQGDGSRAAMDMALVTGDQADNQHRNETEWVVRLLEGGTLDPNSGVDDFRACPGGVGPLDAQVADPLLYAGVQDYDDYVANDQFYDPDQPIGQYADWPIYVGLMDRGQEPFRTPGLDVPSYVTPGNHDGLAQGNQASNAAFEEIATGCIKPLIPLTDLADIPAVFDPANLLALFTSGSNDVMVVPPDPNRQLVDKLQYKQLHDTGAQADAHGYAFVDEAELAASSPTNDPATGVANYYAWNPKPGLRMISIDTLCEGGVAGDAASGNIDDPQFQWLDAELAEGQAAGDLMIAFGHHPIRSLNCRANDEVTSPECLGDDEHGHDTNPGCDKDPRDSSPVHGGADLTNLFLQYPNLVAYVGGHTHENTLTQVDGGDGPGGFWGIESASMVDWPPQSRLIELMDNCDGTLSFFGTVIDAAAPATAPPGDEPILNRLSHVADLDTGDLASIGRTLSYNDPQVGFNAGGQGEPADRNVELLLEDPRPDSSSGCPGRGGSEPPDGDDDGDGGGSADDPGSGSLPFTGFLVGTLMLVGLGTVAGGLATRRLGAWWSRRRGPSA